MGRGSVPLALACALAFAGCGSTNHADVSSPAASRQASTLAAKTTLTPGQALELARQAVVIAQYCADVLDNRSIPNYEAKDYSDAIDAFVAGYHRHPYASYSPEHMPLRQFIRKTASDIKFCDPAGSARLRAAVA